MRMGPRWRCRSRSDQDHRDTPAPQAFFSVPCHYCRLPVLNSPRAFSPARLGPARPLTRPAGGLAPLGQAEPQGLGRGG